MRNYDTPVRAIRHKVYVEVAKAGFESTDETLIHDIEAIPEDRTFYCVQDHHSGTSFLYRTDFLRTGLRRFYHQTASCFSQSYCNRTNRTFYLDDTSVCSCRYLFS